MEKPSAGARWLAVLLRNDWILGLIIIALGAVLTVGLLALFRCTICRVQRRPAGVNVINAWALWRPTRRGKRGDHDHTAALNF